MRGQGGKNGPQNVLVSGSMNVLMFGECLLLRKMGALVSPGFKEVKVTFILQ